MLASSRFLILGDVTPDYTTNMIYSFLLILIGLSLVSMCLSLVQLKMEQLVNDMIEKIKNKRLVAYENDLVAKSFHRNESDIATDNVKFDEIVNLSDNHREIIKMCILRP